MTKLCPFRKADAPPDFDPSDGTWLWVTDYGAVADGETDDRDAIEECMWAAVGAGKGAYMPPGHYRALYIEPPNGVTLRGAGPNQTTIETLYDAGDGGKAFYLANHTDLTLRGFKLLGPITNGRFSGVGEGIYMGNSHRITIQDIWLDQWEFALRSDSGGRQVGNSDISIIDCKTLSKNLTGYLAANTTGIIISGCDFDSDVVANNDQGPGPSHQFYFNNDISDVLVENTTFRNGCSWAIQIYPGPSLSGMTFKNITFTNVRVGTVFEGASGITFDGVTATSNRYEPGYSWFKVNSGSNILVKNAEVWDAPIGTGFTAESVVAH